MTAGMARELPSDHRSFLEFGIQFQQRLRTIKRDVAPPPNGWYPFETLSSFPAVTGLIAPFYGELSKAIQSGPVLDLGCGDGDFSMLFGALGRAVDAVDNARCNYNAMAGVRSLAQACGLGTNILDADLDAAFPIPDRAYGLALFLGTLYHLKNPYGVLENLAYRTRWCILSTRVAQVTPRLDSRIDEEPLAYLASGCEIDNDATNYWIFSPAGLRRILQRTRWAIAAERQLGCLSGSNPVDPARDQRMFVLLKSRVFFRELQVHPVCGLYAIEDDTWCWTARTFALQVILPLETPLHQFSLDFFVPQAIVAASPLTVSAFIEGELVGSATCRHEGALQLTGNLPITALHAPVLTVEFRVDSLWHGPQSDNRDLGLCIPLLPEDQADTTRLPFRVS